ncbi:hypothetical protein [Nonomuraea ceibae]|uniref:hypothetical protein n=1 Tax=Nonomuraea ceibae TaxID=1935170 RepID=UPI001C5D0673|nr:hypothetical protein [Nonomuraea ceibae]
MAIYQAWRTVTVRPRLVGLTLAPEHPRRHEGLIRRAERSAVAVAPTFCKLRQDLQDLLAGRRVVSFGRSHVYSVLYCELEYHVWSDCLEDGVVTMDHLGILDILGRSTFECAQLAYSRYLARWNTDRHRPALLKHPSRAVSAAERSQVVLKVLRDMAAQAPAQYLHLCRQAKEAERSGRSHRRVETQGEHRVRLAPARQAVLIRAGSRCENPSCPDSGYTHDVTDKGEPLLQVHHIDEHAQGGRDHRTRCLRCAPTVMNA